LKDLCAISRKARFGYKYAVEVGGDLTCFLTGGRIHIGGKSVNRAIRELTSNRENAPFAE